MRKKKAKKGQIFLIDVPIWDTSLIISICQTDDEWEKLVFDLAERFAPDYEPSSIRGDGMTVLDEHNDPVAIRLSQDPTTSSGAAVLAHEISHTVQFMLDRRGLTRSIDSEEAYAYTTSYLTRTIYENLK